MPLHAPQRFATRIPLIRCSLSLLLVPRGIINAFCNRPTVNEPYWNVSSSLDPSTTYLRPSLHLYPSPVRSRSPNYPTPLRNRYSSLLVKTCLPNNRFYRFYADSAKRSFLFFLFSLEEEAESVIYRSPKFRVRDSKRRAMFQHRLHRRSTLRHPRLNFNW